MTRKTRLSQVCSGILLLYSVLTVPQALAAADAAPLNVVASFSIITDLAQNVGGERVRITTLVGPDGDSHAYEPKPNDARAIARADVVLVNGLQLEGFLPRLVEASETQAPVVKLTQGIRALPNLDTDDDHDHDHGEEASDHDHDDDPAHHHHHGPHDPHAWQSVRNAQIYVMNIATAFCAADAQGCDDYRQNAADYNLELTELDQRIRAAVNDLPENRRTVMTSHDAFGYFQHEYGLKFLATQGISTAAEPSAADVAALVRQARKDKAAAIFVENISDPRLARQIAREAGVQVGGTLYSDALSAAEGPAPTYIRMMEYNVDTLVKAIKGR